MIYNNLNLNNNIKFTSGNYDNVQKNLDGASKILNKASESSRDAVELGKFEKRLYEFIGKPFRKILNSKRYDNFTKSMIENKKGIASEAFQKLLIFGNTGKEIIRCLFYTGLTLTNQDMPYDKRLFVSMFHVGVGMVSISLQLILGLGSIKYQDKYIDKLLNKYNLEKSVHNRTKAGLKFFIPLVLTNVVAKRLIAPAFATPFAGIQKKKLMEKDDKKPASNPINPKNASNNNEKSSQTKPQ